MTDKLAGTQRATLGAEVRGSGLSAVPFTPEYLNLLKELLPITNGPGAYYVGLVSGLAWKNGLQPDKKLLTEALGCFCIAEALVMFDRWDKRRRRSPRTSSQKVAPTADANKKEKEKRAR